MRFAVVDSSDSDEIASLDLSSGSESEASSSSPRTRNPRSSFGREISAALDSSEDEVDLDSEDEIELLGLSDEKQLDKTSWREMKRHSSATPSVSVIGKDKGKGKASSSISNGQWKILRVPRKPASASGRARLEDILRDEPSQYDQWLENTDKEAWRDGQRTAQARRGELRLIATNARARVRDVEARRLEKEEEEIRRLLEGMVIKQTREEEETARKFAEREQKLWADIDAAIKEVEKREAELAAATQAAAQRQKEEAAARTAAAEKAAAAKKAEEERLARERAEAAQRAKEAKEAEEKTKAAAVAAEREKQEAQVKASADKGKAGSEWRRWVDKQRWMKKEVIEVIKADRSTKVALRQGMRLMTRGLGQVVNTKESIVRITNDLNEILNQQLPTPPSSTNPTTLVSTLPKPYAYLLSHVAKAMVKQAENEVNAKADAAFPLARIVLGLLLRGHAALGEVLFARFVKKCPWVIPFYPARQPDQPREEYEKSTGRGLDESLSEYISRMAGICTLYFAILQTPLSSLLSTIPNTAPNPEQLGKLIDPILRLPQAWTWLSLSLRDPMPSSPPIAHLISTWIEITASEVVRVYGAGQLVKVFDAIQREGLGEGGRIKGDSQAARERLGLIIGDWKSGGVKVPNGRVWE